MRLVLVLKGFSSWREFWVRAQMQRYVCGALQLTTGFGGQRPGSRTQSPLPLGEGQGEGEAGTRVPPPTPALPTKGEGVRWLKTDH
jgi:hypothetical protein